MKLGFEHMKVVQEYDSFARIVSLALGGSDGEVEDTTPNDMASAQMMFSALMRG
jgi:hypothetical protein